MRAISRCLYTDRPRLPVGYTNTAERKRVRGLKRDRERITGAERCANVREGTRLLNVVLRNSSADRRKYVKRDGELVGRTGRAAVYRRRAGVVEARCESA